MEWLVCHDAGGAELVSAWAKARPRRDRSFVLEGPALQVFRRKFGDLPVCDRQEFAGRLAAIDNVLTGTGWASDLEKWAMREATSRGARVAAFLDHWSNYAVRFEWNGSPCLPDEIWVGDRYALALAQKQFPGFPVVEVPNDYLLQVVAEIKALEAGLRPGDSPVKIKILYICEALGERLGAKAPGEGPEFDAMERFFLWLQGQALASPVIRLRLHPAEKPGKYDVLVKKHPELSLEISPQTTLAQDCAWADWVASMGSMALVVALAAGKKTFSCMPKPGQPCPLPHREIQSI